MTKVRRYIESGGVYFITSVTEGRIPILVDVSARFMVVNLIYHKYLLDYKLFGYVVMPEHFHLLIQPSKKYNISKIMNLVKGNFARKYNEIHNRQGTKVWQQGFHDSVVRDEKEINKWLEYMHWNPVKKGLVKSPAEYEFSSHCQYYGITRKSIYVPIDRLW
jgi:putative transposase